MGKRGPHHGWRISVGIVFYAFVLEAMQKISAKEQVRAELARMQKQTGLSLVSFHYGSGKAGILETVAFSSRYWSNTRPFLDEGKVDEGAISPDGSQIA